MHTTNQLISQSVGQSVNQKTHWQVSQPEKTQLVSLSVNQLISWLIIN